MSIKLWDVGAQKEFKSLKGHNDAVTAVVFAPDSARLLSIVREFVAREGALSGRDRARLATEIASRIRPHVSGIDATDDLAFLRALASTLREAGERRP